jgi:hypothetical protein
MAVKLSVPFMLKKQNQCKGEDKFDSFRRKQGLHLTSSTFSALLIIKRLMEYIAIIIHTIRIVIKPQRMLMHLKVFIN